jgi:hypothetical protein
VVTLGEWVTWIEDIEALRRAACAECFLMCEDLALFFLAGFVHWECGATRHAPCGLAWPIILIRSIKFINHVYIHFSGYSWVTRCRWVRWYSSLRGMGKLTWWW